MIIFIFFVWNCVPCSTNSFLLMLFLMPFDLLQVNDVDGWALTDQMIAALFVDYMHSHQLLFWWEGRKRRKRVKSSSTSRKKCFSLTKKNAAILQYIFFSTECSAALQQFIAFQGYTKLKLFLIKLPMNEVGFDVECVKWHFVEYYGPWFQFHS